MFNKLGYQKLFFIILSLPVRIFININTFPKYIYVYKIKNISWNVSLQELQPLLWTDFSSVTEY